MSEVARRVARMARHGRQPEDRAERAIDRGVADAMAAEARQPQQRPHLDRDQFEAWLSMFSKLSERPMALTRVDRDRRNAVVQRCRACCAEVVTRLTDAILASEGWAADLAHAIRYDYDAHRCAPVEANLHQCSADELFEHHAAAEREMIRVAERAAAMLAAINARVQP